MDVIKPWFGRYFAVLFATWGGLLVAGILLERFFGFSLPAGGVAVIPPMMAGLHVGQRWAEAQAAPMPSRPAWLLAAIGGGVYVLAQAALFVLVLTSLSRAGGAAPGGTAISVGLGLLALVGLASALLGRLFLGLGAKGALKRRR